MNKLIIPEKPSDVSWTDDQWKAINASGRDILVAAAAGSGKTAVLVERIIRKITSKEDPVNIDELLIVTFTNAAAAEMRQRIGSALEGAMDEDPASPHLRRQGTLLNKAHISTLHSFCLEVVRKYYYLIDVDPAFRIGDQAELLLLRDEVLDDFLEEEYGKENNEEFYRLVDTFSGDRSDEELQTIITELYKFARAHPEPDRWLRELSQLYDVKEGEDSIDGLPFIQTLKSYIDLQLEAAEAMLGECLNMVHLPGGPAPREEMFRREKEMIHRLRESLSSWNHLYEEMQAVHFPTLKGYKGDEYDPELKERSKELRTEAKDIVLKLQKEYFAHKPDIYVRNMEEMHEVIDALARLVQRFTDRFQAAKREKGLVDFSDLEHFTLDILTNEEGGPSEAASAYRQQFKEIFLDEYQDFNIVQESIIQLLKTGNEDNGNVFMVGDVKQSIYRFRLAEPNLFLEKYRRFSADGEANGLRIDLSQNFRSRMEVLAGTNFLFKQIMDKEIGEIDYDKQAELVLGADYPAEKPFPIEVALIDKEKTRASDEAVVEDIKESELEARWMAMKIKELIDSRYPVYDSKKKMERPIQYRDIVILMRSMSWAGAIKEEFKRAGIPIYAKAGDGYFQAVEVAIMISLLKVIDNPYQDIPLVSVLRSPIVDCTENDLAVIRTAAKSGAYYEAIQVFVSARPAPQHEELHERVSKFLEKLSEWRALGRHGALSALVWQLYRDTNFYDFVGGMPGGKQRQANLRALYDRARQYEETSFRGLFRFLRFIERMQERGEDLGEAGALSEQEDVIRLMTIHASKGLEFPVVFVAGLSRSFNRTDLTKDYLLDKEMGIGAKYINPEKRISYPSLPQLALKQKKRMELLAEEMRVLYVALTRAKEKLFLLGSVKEAEKQFDRWRKSAESDQWLLNKAMRASASSYLGWIGPALVRHLDFIEPDAGLIPASLSEHPSRWSVQTIPADTLQQTEQEVEDKADWLKRVEAFEPVPSASRFKEEIDERMSWRYRHKAATHLRSKQSVSDLKRMNDIFNEGASTDLSHSYQRPIFKRPRFMQETSLTPAEAGTALHTVMQHVSLDQSPEAGGIEQLVRELVARELLTEDQAAVIEPEKVLSFFQTEIGQLLLKADHVYREVPFNMGMKASELHSDWQGTEETVLVQGVIDCLIEKDGKLYLLDYKTDRITGRFSGGAKQALPVLEKRYRLQVSLYAKAVEQIWKRKVDGKFLFFFDGSHVLPID
ncbi:helicase-exonuclease AddAB subunit AddA [Bacillus thermotolerans]|uniref:ATP-dependent helicase/nuclease subunit A n=1 Tax=Bacillus thermotolerans TaxID=1221996 RepID=A0A0F5I4F0_BACTR|nr:helicase-exonuclease AddAB subunit AddA [Bacillus thermotolerans]KKB36785.1 ATP-dependent nuclease, subunit A [Bacillus thermotolerans]KKB40411.1 ATP-dependent nuclease, subunit A [Bacillus thermotolerans]